MSREYSFSTQLSFSRGKREETDIETIKKMIHGCVSVEKTNTQQDREGIDYIATLRRGAKIFIDAKSRDRGCSTFWSDGPEFALEEWSVMPGGKFGTARENAKTGWTLCEKKDTDYILFSFHPDDFADCYLVAFQLLRTTFARNLSEWKGLYKSACQSSGTWESKCLFVPAGTVFSSIQKASSGQYAINYERSA